MRQCCYCGKELKDNRQWCPHCMRHQQEPKRFENTPVERDVRRTRALRVTPCCLTVSTAVLLSVVLVSSGFRSPAPSEVVVPPSESDAPVVLTEPEITTDPAITKKSEIPTAPTIPSVIPPVLSPTIPAEQTDHSDNSFQEVEMNFFAQEVTKYLQKKYPKNLFPAEKFSRMQKKYVTIPINTIPADNWQLYLDYSLYYHFFHDYEIDPNGPYGSYSTLCLVCMDSIAYPPILPSQFNPGEDITDVFPGSTRPVLECEFAIEYSSLTSDGQNHLFSVYTFLHRPCLIEEDFNSIEFLELVQQGMTELTWVDSFTREDFPYNQISFFGCYIGKNSSETAMSTQSVAQSIIWDLKHNPQSGTYYDIFVAPSPIGSQSPGEHGGDPDSLSFIALFYKESKT